MSNMTPNPRLNLIKSKAVILEVQENKIPEPAADVLTLFKSNTSARFDTSNEWIIDVFPNMTPILIYVMITALKHSNVVQYRDHSKSTVATICMYYMSIVYGFFLLNDLYVRPTPSAHARNWSECSWKQEFVDFLLSVPVPEFLIPVLSQFHSFQTERTKNVFFVPSGAGFDHDQFFGRVYPISMFAAIHDCIATLPGGSTRIQVYQDLFSRVLYSITAPAFTCVIPDLIGVTIDQADNTTGHYMNSKLYQVFTGVFNPVIFRDAQRRSSLAAISFRHPTFATNNVNVYDLLFSATSSNLRELKVVMQAISSIIKGVIPCKMSLSQFISEPTLPSITMHGYSAYALPTWSYNTNATKPALFGNLAHLTLVSEEDRATDICFLQRPAAAIAPTHEVNDVFYATSTDPGTSITLPANHVIARRYPYALRTRASATNTFPRHNNNDLESFSDEKFTAPYVLVLDTDGTLTISAPLALLTGKIIESFELDGSTVEMPNAAKSLGLQNCMFADSAVSYRYAKPGTNWHPQAPGTCLPPLARAHPSSKPRLPASSLLHNRTKVFLPVINRYLQEDTANVTILPGMTRIGPVNTLRYTQSMIGFNTIDGSSNEAALDAVPGMNDQGLLIWSPYTYTPYEDDDLPIPDLSASRHYYLMNLRTFFGTDYNLIGCKHPYESLPSA